MDKTALTTAGPPAWDTIPDRDGLRAAAAVALQAAAEAGPGRLLVAPRLRPFQPLTCTHVHQTPELFLHEVGSGVLRLADGEALQPLRPGTVTVVPRGVAHDELPDHGPYRNLVLALHDAPGRIHAHLRLSGCRRSGPYIVNRVVVADPRVARAIGYLNEAAHAEGSLRAGLSIAGAALLAEILASETPEPALDPLVEHARHLLRTHVAEPDLGTGWIASVLGCHPDHLSHRFRQMTGVTLGSEITTARIDLAQLLLRRGGGDIARVARACGFRDPAYFSRVFHRVVGQSPRAWLRGRAAAPVG